VLGIVWDLPDPEPTGREVADTLPVHAYTTVATVLDRLVNKGLLRRRREGRSIRFSPVGDRGAHTALFMRQALVADSDPDAALAWFARSLTAAEAGVLRRALDERSPHAAT
jgi:predicted transcriptional regulator